MITRLVPLFFALWVGNIVGTSIAQTYRLDNKYNHSITPVVLKMIDVESGRNPRAKSKKGAMGLLQLMPSTARKYAVDPYNPKENIEGGIRALKEELERFGNLSLALAAYNCGSPRVLSAIKLARSNRYEDIEYYLPLETQKYVKKILS